MVGSILLVAITVSSFIGLGLLISSLPGPPNQLHASLKTEVHPGPDQVWGTGDEEVRIRHLYGESILESGASIHVIQNGIAEAISDTMLGFSGDSFDLGETWVQQRTLNFNDQISVSFAVPHGTGTRLLSTSTVITGQTPCTSDTSPPAGIVSQNPPDLVALTGLNPMNVTVQVIDTCNPVDQAVHPTLEFNLGVGSPVTMNPLPGDQWWALIQPPPGGWALLAGQTLTYQVKGMADLLGNIGDAKAVSEYIDPIPPTRTYVDSAVNVIGSHLNLGGAQSDDDLNSAAVLSEGAGSSGGGTLTLYADHLILNEGWSDENRAVDGFNSRQAKFKELELAPIEVGLPNAPPTTNQILSVTIAGSGHIAGYVNDAWQMNACTSNGCTQVSGNLASVNPPSYLNFTYDISNKRPGGGPWTWTDINELTIRAYPKVVFDPVNLNENDGAWFLDALWAVVDHGPGYDMDIEFHWTGVPAGASHNLELNYLTNGGAFKVQIWDSAASQWFDRGPVLNSAFLKPWSLPINADEWNGGNPQIRFKSLLTDPSTPSDLHIEYARVTS